MRQYGKYITIMNKKILKYNYFRLLLIPLLTFIWMYSVSAAAQTENEVFEPGVRGLIDTFQRLDDGFLVAGRLANVDGFELPALTRSDQRRVLVRLNSDGSVDTSFSPLIFRTENPSQTFFTEQALSIESIVLLNNDQIVIAGFFDRIKRNDTIIERTGLVRLNQDGSIDSSFNPILSFSGPSIALTPGVADAKLTNDSKLLLGGNFDTINGETRSNIARLELDGTLDESFMDVQIGGGFTSVINSIAIQSDGAYVIGGIISNVGSIPRRGVARLNNDGTLDDSFTDPNLLSVVHEVAIQQDGKILVAGTIGSLTVFRLNEDGTRDPQFSPMVDIDCCLPSVTLTRVLPDGNILIGGFFQTINGLKLPLLAKLNASGNPVTSLVLDPDVLSRIENPFVADVSQVSIDSDGNIYFSVDYFFGDFVSENPEALLFKVEANSRQGLPCFPVQTRTNKMAIVCVD